MSFSDFATASMWEVREMKYNLLVIW